jgi:hypothetical protein
MLTLPISCGILNWAYPRVMEKVMPKLQPWIHRNNPDWSPETAKKYGPPPAVKKEFDKTPYAERLKATGVIVSCICPLMYMNNPLCKSMPVMTSSNKLRTYTTARYYTESEILAKITKGGN